MLGGKGGRVMFKEIWKQVKISYQQGTLRPWYQILLALVAFPFMLVFKYAYAAALAACFGLEQAKEFLEWN